MGEVAVSAGVRVRHAGVRQELAIDPAKHDHYIIGKVREIADYDVLATASI